MATAAVALPSHASHFEPRQSHHAPPKAVRLRQDLSELKSVDFSNLGSADMSVLSPEARMAVDLISAYRKGKLPSSVQEYLKSTYSSTIEFDAPVHQARGKKSVTWDESKLESLGRYANDGFSDHGSDWKKLMDRDWKGFNSRASYWRESKLKKVQKDHWAKREAAYEVVRGGGDEWGHVPTSIKTLEKDFPLLYRYPTRPTLGMDAPEGSKDRTQWDEIRSRWDEEDLQRMQEKLKPLREITGPMRSTGNRTTAMAESTPLEDRKAWAMDFNTMKNKYMNVLCDTSAQRRQYLGLSEGEDEPLGMKRLQESMRTAREQKTRDRNAKIEKKVSRRLAYNVPTVTDDAQYANLLNTAASDLRAYEMTQKSTDGVTRERGTREYRNKLKNKGYITDEEKTILYPATEASDDVNWLSDLGADKKTLRGFVEQVKRMRESGQTVVRPSALYNGTKLLERMKGRNGATHTDASEEDDDYEDDESDDESLDGVSSLFEENSMDDTTTSSSLASSSSTSSVRHTSTSTGTSASSSSTRQRHRIRRQPLSNGSTSTASTSTLDDWE